MKVDRRRVYWHVTFQPHRRAQALWGEIEQYLYELIEEAAKRLEVTVIKVVAMPDHVHMLITAPPWVDLIEVIAQTKGYTARRILQRFPELRLDMQSPGFWASGYHYTRHSQASLPSVLRYLENQKTKGGLE